MANDSQTHLATLAPNRAHNRRPVVFVRPMSTLFVRTRARRVIGITMGVAFFPRVLKYHNLVDR